MFKTVNFWKSVSYLLTLLLILSISGYALVIPSYGSTFDNFFTDSSYESRKKQLLGVIEQNYWYETPNQEEIVNAEFKGIVSSLPDPYNEFITSEDLQAFNDSLNQRYEGVGILFNFDTDMPLVEKVFKGSPAIEGGVEAGDILLEIDDQQIFNWTQQEVVTAIRGPEGESVKLTFSRNGESLETNLIRRAISPELVSYEKRDSVGIITISSFGDNIDKDLEQIAANIKTDSEITGLILDLRGNSGGLLNQAISITSYFQSPGQLVLKEKSKDGDIELSSRSVRNSLEEYPLVILIDRFSASASEIVAGALRDNKNRTLIGQTTFGKGLVQRIFELKNGHQVKLTIAEWFTPSGAVIQEEGLSPDIEVDREGDALQVGIETLTSGN